MLRKSSDRNVNRGSENKTEDMKVKKVGIIILALALALAAVIPAGAAFASSTPSKADQPEYSSPPYTEGTYGTQWTVSGITPTKTVTIKNGAAGRIWQVYQVNNVDSVPLNKAIATIQVFKVEVGDKWYTDSTHLALVQVLNSNGVFTNNGAYVQHLGTIEPGSYSQHVLNMAYDSSVQKFIFWFSVWYIP